MQRAVAGFQGIEADMSVYRKNRDMLVTTLSDSGFTVVPPGGAFYLFPQSPEEDEMKFIAAAREENVLVVPGRGFGRKGHFRIAYCLAPETVERSLPAWRKLGSRYFGRKGGRS
jgi:aspartate aminotransferase